MISKKIGKFPEIFGNFSEKKYIKFSKALGQDIPRCFNVTFTDSDSNKTNKKDALHFFVYSKDDTNHKEKSGARSKSNL